MRSFGYGVSLDAGGGVPGRVAAGELTDCPQGLDNGMDIGRGDGGSAVSDERTPAQIEADIVRRRQDLAATLNEIGVRVHPKTIVGNAQDSVRQAVDRTAGRAYVVVNRAVSDARTQFVGEDGAPRMDRIVPVAVAVVTLAIVVAGMSSRRRRG